MLWDIPIINISKEFHSKMETDLGTSTIYGSGGIYGRTVNTPECFVFMPVFMPEWILRMQSFQQDLYDYDSQNF